MSNGYSVDEQINRLRQKCKQEKKGWNKPYYPFEVLKKKVREAKIENYPQYLLYRQTLPAEEKKLWPIALRIVYRGMMSSKAFFYRGEEEKLRLCLKIKKEMEEKGVNSRKKYHAYRRQLPPEKKKEWSHNPHETFRGFYAGSFYGRNSRSVKKYSAVEQRSVIQEKGIANRRDFHDFLDSLSGEERMRWHYKPWLVLKMSEKDFFGRRRRKRFHSPAVLRAIFLREKALYYQDLKELRKTDAKIPARPQDSSWFSGWDDLFPYRQDPELEQCRNRFFYVKDVLQRKLRTNLVFHRKDYFPWLSSLPPREARLFRRDLCSTKNGWSWQDPELLEFQSTAEVSLAARKLELKSRAEYYAACEKYPALPKNPESFFDWPSRLEDFSQKEAWEIFFGTFDEGRINIRLEDPFFNLGLARRDIRRADQAETESSLEIFQDPLEETIGSEAAMDLLVSSLS